MNTSATGGVLQPDTLDDELDRILQALIASITGLDGSLVRPRWQAVPPKQPEPEVNWCALGVISQEPDAVPWIAYDPVNSDGLYFRHETLEVLASFYGPQGRSLAAVLRDGLALPQNSECLAEIRFVASGVIRQTPELVNQGWIRRCDMSLSFRRKVTRRYPIENLVSVNVRLRDDTVIDETILVTTT